MHSQKLLLFLLFFVFSNQVAFSKSINRLDIQNLFEKTPGNASRLLNWKNNYLNRRINWKGSIYSIRYQPYLDRTEVAMKILPSTLMYDTIVYLPGDLENIFRISEEVDFSGVITRGVDMLGVKEVEISIGKTSGDKFGKFVFLGNTLVEKNLFKGTASE